MKLNARPRIASAASSDKHDILARAIQEIITSETELESETESNVKQ